LAPGQEEFCFPLSQVELDRLRDFAPARGWFAQENNSSAFVQHVARLFPGEEDLVEELFPPRKSHYRLAVDKTGACVFLKSDGCGLPIEARPYYCRLFPVWLEGDELRLLSSDCLAQREARGMAVLMRGLGMTPAKVKDLHARLRLAWGLPPAKGLPKAVVSYARDGR
jgi:hypothetical protein